MKKEFSRAISILLMSILFVITGCQSKGESKAENIIITDFTADFSAEYREMKIAGSITATRQGVMDIKITTPDTISGLEVTYKNSQMRILLDSLECSADEAYLPKSSFPQLVYSAISGIADGRQTLSSENENGKIYNLKTSDGNAVLSVDSEDFITEIEVKDADFKISFDNMAEL